MAYLALYRRYRPTGFDRFIGQEHVVRTLKNQIKNDNVSHAYLFCGARGTGKTSAAKIFARAINCLTPVDGSPCGKCVACLATQESNNMDIVEIDAASNNRVEEVRDLREKAQYPPVSCKYKVYIVDEVHMLSESAFNALLKTLEEPPRHAVFILATTEPQKLPATILSRCMRFDFKLIAESELNKLIASIFDDIKLKYEPEAVRLIAKTGEGSVRDCLSIADKCVSYTADGKLRYSDVLEVLGSADKGKVISLVETIIDGDIGKTLEKIDELIGLGKNVTMLSRDISGVLKDIAVIMSVDNSKKILALPDERYNELKEIAEKSNINAALRFLELFASIEQELRYSQNPRVLFEVTALKCAKATNDLSIDGLLSRMTAMEAQLKIFGSLVAENKAATLAVLPSKVEGSVEQALPQEQLQPQQKKKPVTNKAITKATFSEFVTAIRNSNNALLFKIVQTLDGEAKDGNLILSAQSGESKNFLKMKEVVDGFKQIITDLGYSGDVIIKDFESTGNDIETDLKQTFGMDIKIK